MDTSLPNTQQNKTFIEPENKSNSDQILANSRWSNSNLVTNIRNIVRVVFFNDLPDIDFRLSRNVCVVYISEADLVSKGVAYQKKVVRLRKADEFKIFVIVEKTSMTAQYYTDVQEFCVLKLGLVLFPVSSQTEAAGMIIQLFSTGANPAKNPFMRKKDSSAEKDSSSSILSTLQCIPGLGIINAKLLLLNFGSISAINEASFECLSDVVGKNLAKRVVDFLS
ncbi:Fanconi anemia core complex-associated protein 24-like [Argonauta hians]